MSPDIFAYIPARGGSSRVPRKNIKPLGGVPILARVIANLKAGGIANVAVSSDDAEILDVATKAGAVTLAPRAAALSDAASGFRELVREDLPRFTAYFGCEHVLFGLATAALVEGDLYAQAVNRYFQRRPAMMMAVTSYPISPFWALVQKPDGSGWAPLFAQESRLPSQQHPRTCVEAGLFFCMDVARCRHLPALMEADPLDVFEVPADVAVDVDTDEDWAELERRFNARAANR